MPDSFDVSARVWPIVVGDVEVSRVIAVDGLVVVYHGPRRSSVLSGKLEVAYFMRQVLEAPSEEGADNDLIGALANACRFAFDAPEVKPPVVFRDPAVKASIVKARAIDEWMDARTARTSHECRVKLTEITRRYNDAAAPENRLTGPAMRRELQARGYQVVDSGTRDGTQKHVFGIALR
jgi:hypothetical protein